MLLIYICEDNHSQREFIENCVKNYLMIEEDIDARLVLSTENPYDLLNYLSNNTISTGLYFLDVNLQTDINGLELAMKIRELDNFAKIVFITTHSELSYMTFTYKVEAMDYIIKENIGELTGRISDCIKVAYKRYLSEKESKQSVFKFKVGNKIRVVNFNDIFFFESSCVPHKIILHLENTNIEFYGTIKELEELGDEFCRCHKSFVVNKNKIKYIDKINMEVIMNNDESCLISIRGMKKLK